MSNDTEDCKRRGCNNEAVFLVREQYLEETGKGLVEASAHLCPKHTREEHPTNLDPVTPRYRFEVTTLAPTTNESQPTEESATAQRLTQCPDCGWTGDLAELPVKDGTRSCPVCGDDIEVVD